MSVSARGTSRYVEAWDPRKLETPVSSKHIDSSAGQLYPYYDQGMQTAFIVGKGDSTLRTYEVKFDASAVVTLTKSSDYATNTAGGKSDMGWHGNAS